MHENPRSTIGLYFAFSFAYFAFSSESLTYTVPTQTVAILVCLLSVWKVNTIIVVIENTIAVSVGEYKNYENMKIPITHQQPFSTLHNHQPEII